MAVSESKIAEFKMAAIIKLSQNEWMKFFFVENVWIHDGRVQDGCHHQVQSEWMSLSQIELDWVRVLCNMAESKMAEFKMVAISSYSDWISLSQSQDGGECFWVNMSEDNKVSESKMAVSQSNMAEFMMAAIIKFSQNEWVKFFLCK